MPNGTPGTPPPRHEALSGTQPRWNKLTVYGGSPFQQNPTEELWRFDLVKRVWTQVQPDGDPLVRLKRTNAAKVGNQMYIFAGYDFQCSGGTGAGQIWNLDVYSYDPHKN